MATKHSDDLFHLVRSLSKSEKRYFRLYAARYSGEKNYMRLFDAIERQETYDEEAIRSEFEGESLARHLHVAKNYLHKLILRALRAYYAESSPQIRLREMITDIEILYERGLFKQARKLWRGAQRLVERLDAPQLELDLIKLRHLLSGMDSQKLERLDDIHQARRSTLRQIEEYSEYEYLLEKLGNICTQHPTRGPAEYALLDAIMASPRLAQEPQSDSFRVRQLYLWAWATYHYGRNDLENALVWMLRLRKLCLENPHYLRNYPNEFLGVLNNTLTLHNLLRNDEEHLQTLREIEQLFATLPTGTVADTRTTSLFLHSLFWSKCVFHSDRGDFNCCIELTPAINRFFDEYPNFTVNGSTPPLLLLLAYSHFAVGQRGEALAYINRLLNRPEPGKGRSAYYTARLLEIIIHYEIGNKDLVLSRIRSLRNTLTGKDWLGLYEQEALHFFETTLSGKGRQQALERIYPLFDDPEFISAPHRIFFHLDFAGWIESKISGRDFAEVVRERYRKGYEEYWAERRGNA